MDNRVKTESHWFGLTREDKQKQPYDMGRLTAISTRDELGLAKSGMWDAKKKKLVTLPKAKGEPARNRLAFQNIELKQRGKRVAGRIFDVLKSMSGKRRASEALWVNRIVFCTYHKGNIREMKRLIDRNGGLKNWRGEPIDCRFALGALSRNLFEEGTLFGNMFVAYDRRGDVKSSPRMLTPADPEKVKQSMVKQSIKKARTLGMSSIDIISNDFDGNPAKAVVEESKTLGRVGDRSESSSRT